jgi:hypothetical protein
MITTGKPKSTPTSSLQGDIPAEVMAKLQAAYRVSGYSSTEGCPDPETVIVYAFEEPIPEKRAQVYAHLSECRDCLNLVLDLRSAWAEAEGKHQVRERISIRVQAQYWLAGFMDGVRGSVSRLVSLPRLIPITVALVVLAVVGLGVFQRLTAPRKDQLSSVMTNLKPGNTYSYSLHSRNKVGKVSSRTPALASTRVPLPFLALILENYERK